MAFICVIDSPLLPDPEEATAVINIGYDDELNLRYSLVVGIDSLPGGGFEYYFFHQEMGPTGEPEPPVFSSKYLGTFIDRPCRRLILERLLIATRLLITRFTFDEIFFHTYDANLPARAVTKFLHIARILQERGYSVVAHRPVNGRRSWSAKLMGGPRV